MRVADRYPSVEVLLSAVVPEHPVYCIYPHVYRETAHQFVESFPGRVLYAVKACSEPAIIEMFVDAGITHFDCASLAEVQIVHSVYRDATSYFMVPVRIRGEARQAQQEFGVRHFLVDHESGVARLGGEIDMAASVVFARMAVHHAAAMCDLSMKFGAPPQEIPALLSMIEAAGAEPALAFNVGTLVTETGAYRHAISVAAELLQELPMRLRLVDIGGGYPRSYPGFEMPPLGDYFDDISQSVSSLPLAENGEILGEPGRALAGPGLSAISEVLQRKGDKLYINDGMHGIFWELRYEGHNIFPCRCYRNGGQLQGNTLPFTVYGPTCDSEDVLPVQIDLPADIDAGDHLEFGRLGAYSLSGRTDFNGRFSSHIVQIDGADQYPPGHRRYRN